jgi:tetratricopeptide (TPR) repeat protein
MKVGNHRIVLVLIFVSCGIVPSVAPLCLNAADSFLATELGENDRSLAVHYGDQANQAKPQAHAKANPESFDKLAKSAQAAMEADQIPEAIRLYTRATTLRPNWSEGWWHLGTLFFDAGHFTEARDAFAHFVAAERKQPGPGFAMLGLSEFQLKNYPKALAALEHGKKLGLGTDQAFNHTVLFHDGILYNLLGEPEIALQRLTLAANQIAAANPDAPKDAVFANLELLDAFGTAALRIPKLPADLGEAQLPLVRQAGRAQALIALQDYVSAEPEFKQLLALYPSEPGVHYMYGVYLLKEHPSLAVDEFRREIEISPSHAVARIQLALEFLRTADYDQSQEYAREAVALAPQNFAAHVAFGRLWLALGKTDSALQELRTAVKLAPGSPHAHLALSRALYKAGQKAEAAREQAEFDRLKTLSDAADQ